jgi:hypothetical protein
MHLLAQNACWCRWVGDSVSIATFSMNYQSEGGDRQNGCTEFTGSLTRQKRGQPSLLACNLTFHDKDVRSRSVGLDWCRLLLSYEHVADLRFHSMPSILSKPIREQQFNEHHCHGNAHRDIKTARCGTYTCFLKKTCPQTHTQTHAHTHTCLVDFFL